MSAHRINLTASVTWLLLGGFALTLGPATASAEEPTVDEMVCALNPKCAVPFVDRRLRGITTAASERTPGSFDRTVNFPFDSAELTPEARNELDQVAKALKHPDTRNFTILINGHTDAVGTEVYNQRLSQRRAEAARDYLITEQGIEPNRLIAKGYGKSQLLLPSDPTNALNRRVQFQNPNYSTTSVSTTTSGSGGNPIPRPPGEGDGL